MNNKKFRKLRMHRDILLTLHGEVLPNADPAPTTPSPKPSLPLLNIHRVTQPTVRIPSVRIRKDILVPVQTPRETAYASTWWDVSVGSNIRGLVLRGDAWVGCRDCIA